MRVRQHRGGLAESMDTAVEIADTPDALLEWVNEILLDWMPPVTIDKIKIKAQGFDSRIGWNSHLIYVEGFGVVGMSDTAI